MKRSSISALLLEKQGDRTGALRMRERARRLGNRQGR